MLGSRAMISALAFTLLLAAAWQMRRGPLTRGVVGFLDRLRGGNGR